MSSKIALALAIGLLPALAFAQTIPDAAAFNKAVDNALSAQNIDAEILSNIDGFNPKQEIQNIKIKWPKPQKNLGSRLEARRYIRELAAAENAYNDSCKALEKVGEAFRIVKSQYDQYDVSHKKLLLAKINLTIEYVKAGYYKEAETFAETLTRK
jgi:CII-binding regulator of phage lambda lysogenization HflD